MEKDVKDLGLEEVKGVSEIENEEVDLNASVTRGEFIDILTQISENINQMTQYQMDDMNTLYAQHLFPNEIKMSVLESIIMDKLGVTAEELTSKYNECLKDMEERAKELKAEKDSEKEDIESLN